MTETFNNNHEINQGPSGPIFYLVENKNKRDNTVDLARFIVADLDNPDIVLLDSPDGQENSSYVIHDLSIDFAKNGHKELVVEEHDELMDRYKSAASALKAGAVIIKVTNRQDPAIEEFIMGLDTLFPQDKYTQSL